MLMAPAQDLLEKILVFDPDERLVPREALTHPFFTTDMPRPPSISIDGGGSPGSPLGRDIDSPDLYDDTDHIHPPSPTAMLTGSIAARVVTEHVASRPASAHKG
jgi:serine/threonine protein kinase